MSNVTPLPRQPRATHPRPLTFRGAYGRPGGDGLDSLARILLSIAADEDRQPVRQPEPRLRLSALKQKTGMILAWTPSAGRSRTTPTSRAWLSSPSMPTRWSRARMTTGQASRACCATECLSRRKTQMPNKSCGTCHYLERVERTWMVGRCGWLERHPEIKETIPMWLPKVWPPYMFNGEGEDCPVWEATK